MTNLELRHEVIMYWRDDDDAFIAEIPELPGCAADGPTTEAALANIQVVARKWIETDRELGPAIPERQGRRQFA